MRHAYALWDLVHLPDRVRFVSAVRDDATVGYLLIWLGRPARPVVHWFGPVPEASILARALPPRPFVAVVPEEACPTVLGERGAAEAHSVLLLLRERGPSGDRAPRSGVRRLTRADRPALEAWARRGADPVVSEYASGDPDAEHVWGAFENEELVGIAGASVRLPTIWVVAGVYVEPSVRRRGVARSVVSAAIEAAETAGARVGLYAREDAHPARRLYEGLGFGVVGRQAWLDFGGVAGPG